MEGGFMCPLCNELYWREESVIYDEEVDDTICWQCVEALDEERERAKNKGTRGQKPEARDRE